MSEIVFVEKDATVIGQEIIAAFETATGITLMPGDERRMFLQNQVPIIVALYNSINETGKKNLLQYATGEFLDAIGYGITARIDAQFAAADIIIALTAAQTSDVIVPKGTRITPDGALFFAIDEDIVVTAGGTTATGSCTATVAGELHNGYVAGQINKIVDNVPFVLGIQNTSTSGGGADVESDASYRSRLVLANSTYSVAGSTAAYKFHALSADSSIIDVSVSSPAAGEVDVVVLCDGGIAPSAGIKTKVEAALSADTVRPLTDTVTVSEPTAVSYNIELTYYIPTELQAQGQAIQDAVDEAIAAYQVWQSAKLGRDINPDELRHLILNAGANRLTVVAPVYDVLGVDEIGEVGTVTVAFGGYSE